MLKLARLVAVLVVVLPFGIALSGSADVARATTATVVASQHVRWAWPAGGPGDIIRPFIAPSTAYSAGHRGIDIAADGDVRAPADGVVHFSGVVVDRGVLSISHAGGVLSSYEPVVSNLHTGDPVTKGQVIGQIEIGQIEIGQIEIGQIEAGHCSVPCLHFGVRVDGDYVSPLLFLGGLARPVLLPTPGDARARSSP
jgi:murein DD-endopeptidase MepM/ murein hydrolase activator NlpD